jgi:cytochrome P450
MERAGAPPDDRTLDVHGGAAEPAPTVVVRGHAEVVRIAREPGLFSSAVSRYLQIPNGLDGAEHARFRALVDRYFTPEAMADFAPACRAVARGLVAALPRDRTFDAVRDLGAPFAVRAQSAWLGWPAELERPLLDWLDAKQEAVRSGDAAAGAAVAARFDAIVRSVVEPRRASNGSRDVTDRLVHDASAGRPLRDEELVSILRNWTGGDLGSIALAVGVVVHALAVRSGLAERLRAESADERFDAELEECLRLDDPFVASRRVATQGARVEGCPVAAGQRLALDWAAANRDDRVFAPGRFDPVAHAGANLVYGVGAHVCPGRPLARLELRELVRALLDAAPALAPAGDPVRETPPLGAFRSVPVRLVATAPERGGPAAPPAPPG